MPSSTATITAEQRDAIYALTCDHLSGIGDLALAFELGDYEAAERLGRSFLHDLQLLANLGWAEDDDRRNVALTMPPVMLDEALRRLREEAAQGLIGSPEIRQGARHERELSARYRLALETCDELIESLGLSENE